VSDTNKPQLVSINHVALEVADVDRALDFYETLFDIELRSLKGVIIGVAAQAAAARSYSWIRPPSRSRRRMLVTSALSLGWSEPSARSGLSRLEWST
jgi:hypothetical protein